MSISLPDLLIIDSLGLIELYLDKCRDLFEVIDSRKSRKSILFVSQLPVKAWNELFTGGPMRIPVLIVSFTMRIVLS